MVERDKFAKHVVVSADVCYFIPDKAKANVKLYIETATQTD